MHVCILHGAKPRVERINGTYLPAAAHNIVGCPSKQSLAGVKQCLGRPLLLRIKSGEQKRFPLSSLAVLCFRDVAGRDGTGREARGQTRDTPPSTASPTRQTQTDVSGAPPPALTARTVVARLAGPGRLLGSTILRFCGEYLINFACLGRRWS